ncbi:spore gernimation protein GerPD [Ornithinibacillus bavariensis]|uniref:Spore germination protein GerPD n=1 Tax=Ornithinibacillus bavariensis TaxID=545502 RepID=A0A920C640_9BACI|nr:spore gernimation protein GerPD [Ornithinibacillus bavariensis]GIO25719.1 putative spore germination protein GerPD [Ornithinibacillus bavariensis]HAM79875.1 spore gernimation protein GerPD [Ornithinibacillus sp.]
MNIEVHNWGICVGNVGIEAVASSSVFLIGDNKEMKLSSFFDTPPESYIVGALVPLAPQT